MQAGCCACGVHLVCVAVFVSLGAGQVPEKLLAPLTEETDHGNQITRTCSNRMNFSLTHQSSAWKKVLCNA